MGSPDEAVLFNTPMTRAVYDDMKFATRRLLKPQPTFPEHYEGIILRPERCDDGSWCFAMDPFAMICEGSFRPPYEEGEILYVNIMNERQCEIVLALAECDMNVTDVARKLFMHRNTVIYHIERIHAKTGKNPLKFYDLADLVCWITHWMPMPEVPHDLKILDQKKEG